MGWLILILVLIAVAFGVLGAVIKATVVLVLTVIFTVLALGAIAVFAIKRQFRRMTDGAYRGPRLPS